MERFGKTVHETFEIRICDGFMGFTSIFKETTFEQAGKDAEALHAQMTKMGVSVGRIELRGENSKLIEAHWFTAAADRAAEMRRARRVAEFKAKMHEAGLDNDDLMV